MLIRRVLRLAKKKIPPIAVIYLSKFISVTTIGIFGDFIILLAVQFNRDPLSTSDNLCCDCNDMAEVN
jgi:hypothetical protein